MVERNSGSHRLPTKDELESRFTEYVRSFGGEHVADLLPSSNDRPLNADYFLWDRSVVAELKTISADHIDDPRIGDKTADMLRRWANTGVLGRENVVGNKINMRGLPTRYTREALEIASVGLLSAVATASKQIRATRAHFALPAAKGLLIVANLADRRLSPEVVIHLLGHVVRKHTRTFHSFIFFSPAIDLQFPGSAPALWMSGAAANPLGQVDESLLRSLGEGWHDYNA